MKFVLNVYQKKINKRDRFYTIMSMSYFDAKLYNSILYKFVTSVQKEKDNKELSQTSTYYIYTFKVPFKYRKIIKEEILILQRNISRYFYIYYGRK